MTEEQKVKVLMKKASNWSFGEITELSEHEIVKMMKESDEGYVVSRPDDYGIKKYGSYDLEIMLYDDYIE